MNTETHTYEYKDTDEGELAFTTTSGSGNIALYHRKKSQNVVAAKSKAEINS